MCRSCLSRSSDGLQNVNELNRLLSGSELAREFINAMFHTQCRVVFNQSYRGGLLVEQYFDVALTRENL